MTGQALDRKRLYHVGNLSIFMIGLGFAVRANIAPNLQEDIYNQIDLASGRVVDYDYLVIATGPELAFDEIEGFGPAALFTMISVGHGVLVLFGLTRMRARPTATKRTPYVYAPRTSFTIGRLMRRSRERDAP